jgi:transcriptional regulator with GAF, ATPase, and Fis domain
MDAAVTATVDAHFEDLITELAASFVHVDPDALDAQIVESLRRIVLFLGIDRSTIGRFDDAGNQLMRTHSWAIPGIEPLPSPLRIADFPNLTRRLQLGEQIVLERVGELPAASSTDLQSLRRAGLKSMAAFPLTARQQTLGWVSFGSIRAEREWPEALIRRLRLVAGVFANALARRQQDNDLRQALVENERLRQRLESENAAWREEVLHAHEHEAVVGESRALRRVAQKIDQVAQTDSTVLLLGETGTGKDLIAATLHGRSLRAQHPLIRVNCAALPAALMESELFGHERGAFTGAVAQRPGRFELADGGTIVLDEIGELPMELQAKLLRVLQSGEFERLGASETRRTDARVIAATNRDLEMMIAQGQFRADLYYRISVFPIRIPPLRERREDIPALAAFFIDKLQPKLGRKALRLTDQALASLIDYEWPGNVRELENIIERSLIISPGPELIIEGIHEGRSPVAREQVAHEPAAIKPPALTLAEVERDHIRAVCAQCGWRINGKGNAAEQLGLNPNTLRSKMSKLGIKRPSRASDSARLEPL